MSENTLLAHAKALANNGNSEAAENALLAHLNIQPADADAVLLLAQLYFKASKFNKAIALLSEHLTLRACADALREYYVGERMNEQALQLLNSLPKNGSLENLIDQAITAQISGNANAAIALCRNVLSFQPDNAFALNHLGRALFNAKQASEAQQAFEHAIQCMPEYYQAWHNLGHVLRAKNDTAGAEKAYQKSIAIAPYYQSALVNLALLLMNQGNNLQAISYLERAIALNPTNAEALLNLGICRQILREFDLAKQAFERATQITPVDPRALRHLGNLYKEQQDSQSAVLCYRQALQINPSDSDIWAELISTLELLNNLDDAQVAVNTALQHIPNDANILFESAKLARRNNNNALAIQILQSINLPRLHPRLVQSFHYERATVLDRLGRYSDAFADYTQGNTLAATSIRARSTDKTALPRQMDAIQQWLAQGAPAANSDSDEDLGADLCFLIGFPRSGTTLLDVMLDGHTQVLSLEEKPSIERVAFKLDQLPGHYPFAMSSLSREQRHDLRTAYRETIAEFRQPQHSLVLDKMPIRTIHAAFIHRLFPKAKFLFVERHPCDVVLSNFMQHYAINEAMIHFTQLASTVDVYNKVMHIWQQCLAVLPELSVQYVRYETLISDTENTLRSTCEFLGLPWQSGLEQHQQSLENRKQIKTNSYHQVAEPVYQRSKYRWLNFQTQLQPFMATLDVHIKRMGY
jgi:Tfp pilus assembly protein PilF